MAVTLAIVLALYLSLLFVVGLWANRRVQTEADYIIAGRRLPLSLSTATLFATWFGAGTLLTATDEIRVSGLAATALEPYGAGVCLLLAGIFLARRLWSMGVYTVSDVFKVNFGGGSETLSVAITVPGYIGWLAIQLVALAGILEVTLEIPMTVGVMSVAAVSLAYTLVGGMWSVTVTDALQMVFILLGVMWLGYEVFDSLGDGSLSAGLETMRERASPESLVLIPRESLAKFVGWLSVLLVSMLGNLPSQELAQRILASKSAVTARRACMIAGILYIALGTVPVLLGVTAQFLLPADKTTSVLQELALKFLSPGMVVLFVVSMLSVVMSTITSGLLAPATALSHNLIRKYVPETVSSLALCRYCVVFVLICSVGVALIGEDAYSILEVSYGVGLGMVVPFIAGIYALRASDRAALTSMLVAIVIWGLGFVWDAYSSLLTVIAIVASVAAFAIMRRVDGAPSPQPPAREGA